MSYPTLMYRCPGAHFAYDGHTYEYCAVADEQEHREMAIQGWCMTLVGAVEAISKPVADPVVEEVDDAPAEREELEHMAAELGIKFDGRTTDTALLKKINTALGE